MSACVFSLTPNTNVGPLHPFSYQSLERAFLAWSCGSCAAGTNPGYSMATPLPSGRHLSSKAASVHTSSVGPRAKPLYELVERGEPDFLSKLEQAERRDTERLSHRSLPAEECSSPPASRRPTPPPLDLPTVEAKASSSVKGSARSSITLELQTATSSARGPRSTPRPSPHPTSTPRAPRAVRTPKGEQDSLVQGYPTFNSEAIRNAQVRGAIAGLSFLSARNDAHSPEL